MNPSRLSGCTKCPLHETANCVGVKGRGAKAPTVLFVGEAPGKMEDAEGVSFVGGSGQILDDICQKAGLSRDTYRYENVVKCIPWNDDFSNVRRPDEATETAACAPYLYADIHRYDPKVIVAVGATAAKFLTGKGQITKIAGTVIRAKIPRYIWNEDRTEAIVDPEGVVSEYNVIPIVHPASILYGGGRDNPEEHPVYYDILRSIKLAVEVSTGKDRNEDRDYKFIKTLDEVEAFVRMLLKMYKHKKFEFISVDIETSSKKKFDSKGYMWSLQVAWEVGKSRCILVEHPESQLNNFSDWRRFAKLVKKLLDTIPVAGQRFQFDYTWLYYYFSARPKVMWDTLFMHHCLFTGEEPNDLEFMSGRYLERGSYKWRMTHAMNELHLKKGQMDQAPIEVFLDYACEDPDAVLELVPILRDKLLERKRPRGGTLLDTYHELYRSKFDMAVGITIDGIRVLKERYNKLKVDFPKQVEEVRRRICDSKFYEDWREKTKVINEKHWVRCKRIVAWEYKCGLCNNEYITNELTKDKQLYRDTKTSAVLLKPRMGCQHRCKKCGTWGALEPLRITPKVLRTETIITKTVGKNGKVKEKTREKIVEVKPKRNPYEPEYTYLEFNPNSQPNVVALMDLMELPMDAGALFDDDDDWGGKKSGGDEEGGRETTKKVMKNLVVWCNDQGFEAKSKTLLDIMESRKLSKLYSSYVKKLPDVCSIMEDTVVDNRPCRLTQNQSAPYIVRAWNNLSGTRTGRMSNNDPSLQQMPFKSIIKWMYVSKWYEDGGLLLCTDYSQMELRLFTMITHDAFLLEAFLAGRDVHRAVAALLFGKPESEITTLERKKAKTLNFGILYGKSARSLAYELGISEKEAEELLALYWEKLPTIAKYIEEQQDEVMETGESWTPTGRRRPIKEVFDNRAPRGVINRAKRKMVNTPIQGGASDLNLVSADKIRRMKKKLGLKSTQYAMVHDSNDQDVYPGEFVRMARLVRRTMEKYPPVVYKWADSVPIEVELETGVDWQRQMVVKDLGKDDFGNDLFEFSGKPDYWPEIKEQLCKSMSVSVAGKELSEKDNEPFLKVKVRLAALAA